MGFETAKAYLEKVGIADRIKEFEQSSATVELAAEAEGVIPARICKTISFKTDKGAVLICTSGDAKIDNRKFKDFFGIKAKMLTPDEVVFYTNHEIGGVCPFGLTNEDTEVYSDVSLKRFDSVVPACGSSNSAVEVSPDEMFRYSNSIDWIDVCKNWQERDNDQK